MMGLIFFGLRRETDRKLIGRSFFSGERFFDMRLCHSREIKTCWEPCYFLLLVLRRKNCAPTIFELKGDNAHLERL